MLLTIFICILAGCGAGLTTGFAGLSAAVFITPLLVSVLKVPVYEAVGVALASDVLASAISAWTYGKEGNLDLKRGRTLFILVVIFAVVGSLAAYLVTSVQLGDTVLSYWSIIGALIIGISFIIRPQGRKRRETGALSGRRQLLTCLCGVYIGFVCGFQGTGGGAMLLLTLTAVMLFEFKKAVGTSVFIMSFTALIGAVSHFAINGMPDLTLLALCVVSTTVFARIGAVIANRTEPVRLKRITGIMLTVSCLFTFIFKIMG